jgi:anti-sigma-K factor RskA
MEHEALEALVPAYAAGATDPTERTEIEQHLPGCAQCRALLADYQDLCSGLLYAGPLVTAPDALRGDFIRRLDLEARRAPAKGHTVARPAAPRWRWPALGLGLAAALVLLVTTNLYWLSRVGRAQNDLARQATVVAMLAQHPKEVGLTGEAAVPHAVGDFYFDPLNRTGVLRVSGLPPAPSGKAYQLWLIRSGQRDSGGVFNVDETGAGMLVVSAMRPLNEYDGLGITLEPAQGSPGPTTPRLLGGRL